jgi:hypothetical protein
MNREKYLARARIAFGIDERPRAVALKAWEARYNTPAATSGSSSWYKSMNAQEARLKPRPRIKSAVPVFSTRRATNHAQNNAVVDLRADGQAIYASEYAVKSITPAGTDRYGSALVEIETAIGKYLVEARELKG